MKIHASPWYDAMLCWYRIMLCFDVKSYDIWYNMIWCDVMRCDAMRCDTIRYDTICYAMLCYAMLWYDMIWYDMISLLMLCHAMPCHGTAWHGIACVLTWYDVMLMWFDAMIMWHSLITTTMELWRTNVLFQLKFYLKDDNNMHENKILISDHIINICVNMCVKENKIAKTYPLCQNHKPIVIWI